MRKRTIFVVVGRLSRSLTTSKILPILATGRFEQIYVFREVAGDPVQGVVYITSHVSNSVKPAALRKSLQRIYEPLQLIYYSLKLRPAVINGYQLLPKGINSFIAAKLTVTKCVISSIGGLPELDTYLRWKWFWRKLNTFVLKHSDAVTTKGKTVTDQFIKNGVDPRKIFTFNGAIDIGRFKPVVSQQRHIDLLYVGFLSELKGPDRFVEIVEKVQKEYPNVKAHMLGSGELAGKTLNMIRQLGLVGNISLEGFVEETENYFSMAKILIMPSRSEGLSTAMLEAMACGCVPVVSDVGCMSEAAIDGVTAFTVKDYQDISAYARAVLFLLSDVDIWHNVSDNAIDLVRKNYSIESQANMFESAIQKATIH